MAGPTPSWGTVPVFGTWLLLDGTPVAGKVRFTLPQRITNAPGDVIFPRNGVLEFALGAETGSINFDCPVLDDPDNFPDDASVQILVEEIFVNAVNASYYIRPVAAMSGNTPPGLDLRTVVVVSDNPAAPPPSLIRGVPGGVAALDTSGNVLDGAGHPVVGGVASVNGHAGTVVLAASDVGADAAGAAAAAQSAAATYTNGQVAGEASRAAAAEALLAPLASPAFTGSPTVPTQTVGNSSTRAASTAFVAAAITALINGSPGALDTLKELADALGDDANFATTITNALALKAPLASPALTGSPTINGQTPVTALAPSGDTSGVTDTAAIQANENAGVTTVLVPGATYWVNGLIKKSFAHIYFNGATMKLPNGANADVIISDQFATLTGTTNTGGIHNFGIHGPGFIHGNRANQTNSPPTVTSANFNLSASFTLTLSSTAGLGSTGTATLRTQSGPQAFSWTANNTGTNTLTCTSAGTGRVVTGTPVYQAGYGVRVYGYCFDIDGELNIHECVVDGLWTEWASGNSSVGSGTPEMESRISRIKAYENNRNGYSFCGPHDSMIDNSLFFRNGSPGFGIGLVTANGAIAYVSTCHAWGSPQQVGFEDHTASHWVNCYGEESSASGSRGWVFYSAGSVASACHALWAGSGGSVGVEINGASGCQLDMMFTGGFGNGALLITSSGGGNRITGVANSLLTNPIVSGTPDATDIISIYAGNNTTTASFSSGIFGTAAGTAVQGNDVRTVTKVTTTDPLVTSDSASGYGAGSRWINTAKNAMFTCLSAAVGAAVWQRETADVQTFTTSGTWTKPAWAQTVSVVALGGGGGGGAGAQQVSGTACSGGAGGAGGGTSLRTIPASLCGSTEAVTVSSSGASGATGQATTSSAGAVGTPGSAVLFGNHVRAAGGAGGLGGALNAATAAPSGGGGLSLGGAGAAGANGAVGANAATAPCPGGGAGGGISTTPTAFAGGNGAQSSAANYISGGSGGGAAGGTAGQSGVSASANEPSAGSSGGGGGANAAGVGGAGGVAGSYGAGGGGGGSSLNGSTSGAGGAGAPGIVVVITT